MRGILLQRVHRQGSNHDNVQKIVFSRTLKDVDWKNTELKKEVVAGEKLALKHSGNGWNKDIFVGSPGLIVTLANMGLIDEYQLSVQPTIVGTGLTLFKNISNRVDLKLLKTKTIGCGAVTLYYETIKK